MLKEKEMKKDNNAAEEFHSLFDADIQQRNCIAVMKAINEIQFWEKMKVLMPMVAAELVKAGVKFP